MVEIGSVIVKKRPNNVFGGLTRGIKGKFYFQSSIVRKQIFRGFRRVS